MAHSFPPSGVLHRQKNHLNFLLFNFCPFFFSLKGNCVPPLNNLNLKKQKPEKSHCNACLLSEPKFFFIIIFTMSTSTESLNADKPWLDKLGPNIDKLTYCPRCTRRWRCPPPSPWSSSLRHSHTELLRIINYFTSFIFFNDI